MARKILTCSYDGCTKTYQGKGDLEDHVNSIHLDLKVTCPRCGKLFQKTNNTRKRHIATCGNPKKPSRCGRCGKNFVCKYNSERHMKKYCKARQQQNEQSNDVLIEGAQTQESVDQQERQTGLNNSSAGGSSTVPPLVESWSQSTCSSTANSISTGGSSTESPNDGSFSRMSPTMGDPFQAAFVGLDMSGNATSVFLSTLPPWSAGLYSDPRDAPQMASNALHQCEPAFHDPTVISTDFNPVVSDEIWYSHAYPDLDSPER